VQVIALVSFRNGGGLVDAVMLALCRVPFPVPPQEVLLLKSPAVIATILALVLAIGHAHAQQGPGGEPGPGGASTPMMKGANNTSGWNLMSAEEQRAHQAKCPR